MRRGVVLVEAPVGLWRIESAAAGQSSTMIYMGVGERGMTRRIGVRLGHRRIAWRTRQGVSGNLRRGRLIMDGKAAPGACHRRVVGGMTTGEGLMADIDHQYIAVPDDPLRLSGPEMVTIVPTRLFGMPYLPDRPHLPLYHHISLQVRLTCLQIDQPHPARFHMAGLREKWTGRHTWTAWSGTESAITVTTTGVI